MKGWPAWSLAAWRDPMSCFDMLIGGAVWAFIVGAGVHARRWRERRRYERQATRPPFD